MRSGDVRPGMIFMYNGTINTCAGAYAGNIFPAGNNHHLVNIIFYVKLNQLTIDVEMMSFSIRGGCVDNVTQYSWTNKDHNEESFEKWHRVA